MNMLFDPIIFDFTILGFHFTLYWYGLIVGFSVILGAYIVDRGIKWRGGEVEPFWDMFTYVVIGGVLGARLWYVLNDILGGSKYFVNNPGKVFAISEGGIHIYGAILGGVIVGYIYTRIKPYDLWRLFDSVGIALLIGQAFGRIANFINQELYGPPTNLPWGIPITEKHRIFPWNDMDRFPEATTRFHPTFGYEIVWNLLSASIIIWVTRKFPKALKPGSAFYLWLILEGTGRFIIEFWRPDQPKIGDSAISITRVVTSIMVVAGTMMLLNRQGVISISGIERGPENYPPVKTLKKKVHRNR